MTWGLGILDQVWLFLSLLPKLEALTEIHLTLPYLGTYTGDVLAHRTIKSCTYYLGSDLICDLPQMY